jgi:C_GCAxxG_C_C family probable redox protein
VTNHNENTKSMGRICLDDRHHRNRRELLRIASAGLVGSFIAQKGHCAERRRSKFKALGADDHFDVGDEAEKIIEKAYTQGYELEKKHGGCCRCIVAALQNSISFVPRNRGLFRAASCLDGGATPTGLQNCGAFTGSGMLIGWICGTEAFESTELSHRLIRQVYQRFEKNYGTVLCKDVRKNMNSNCPKVVARAAKWTAEVLLGQFADYRQPEDKRDK